MPNGFEVVKPRTRAEALELLAGPQAAPLVTAPRPDPLWGTPVHTFVDLGALDLDYIRAEADGCLHVGAATSLQRLVDDIPLAAGTNGLLERAALQAAPEILRNLACLWGALRAHDGSPELLLALLALEAQVVMLEAKKKPRNLGLPEYLASRTGNKNALLIEVRFAPLPAVGWALERVARTPRDEAIVAAAAVVEAKDGHVDRVRLALAGANPQPVRLETVEQNLAGKAPDEKNLQAAAEAAASQARPVSDFRGSAEYRRAMVPVVVRRALQDAWKRAAG